MIHSDLRVRGGAEAYADAVCQAIRNLGHQVDRFDITGLESPDRRRRPWIFRLADLPRLRNIDLLKYALVCRATPKLAKNYDRVVLTKGEGPFLPIPTLTIFHAPAFFSTDLAAVAALGVDTSSPIKLFIRRLCVLIARFYIRGIRTRSEWLAANSHWTAKEVARLDGGPPVPVLYPVLHALPQEAAAKRGRHRVIAIGRLVSNKRFEDAIRIINLLREQGYPMELDIVGRADSGFAKRLMHRFRNRHYIRFHQNAEPELVGKLLAEARFGLHCFRNEHFGISVAEMILAGVVPIVYDGGGVTELVTQPELRFQNLPEAADCLTQLVDADISKTDAIAGKLQKGKALQQALDFNLHLKEILQAFLTDSERNTAENVKP